MSESTRPISTANEAEVAQNGVSMPPSEAWLSYQYLSGVLKTHL